MVDEDTGQATIVYEDPAEGTVERTVQNEYIAYFQDHWAFKAGEDDQNRDVVRRVPHHRVHYVERSVEEFEEEINTIRNRIQSFADEFRSKLLGDEDTHGEGTGESDVYHIDVESGDSDEGGQ